MATKTNTERLAIMEEKLNQNLSEHQEIKITLEKLSNKLDIAIENKADKTSVDKINDKLWGFIGVFATAFVGLIVYLIQANIK